MHEKHRQRMMERCIKTGFASFADHEVLEMLLYFSKPRGDTNETAHLLLERFGRIDGVFEATPEELMQIDGVGQSSAVLMQLIRESARRYTKAVMQNRKRFMHIREVAEFANTCFVGSTTEQLYLFLFNNGMEMIDSVLLTTGAINSAEIPSRLMLEKAIFKKASCAVLAHNHPHGIAVPSDSDIQLTYNAAEVLGMINIP
ncbi:MAG: DNA repair protein RadC, partial [Clostridia bacterium]|nr:DNA repair protein RadC [Clostridia bacterium]